MIIPKSYTPIVEILEDAADGANQYGAAAGLKQNIEPVIRMALTALVGTPAGPGNNPPAAPGLMSVWNTAKADKTAATAALRSANSNGRALAMAAVNSQLASDLTQDTEDTVNNLPSGTKVNVVVTARNSTGESQPCALVSVVVP